MSIMMENKTAFDLLPENNETIKAIINRKPSWFIRFGGYAAIVLVITFILFVAFLFRKYGVF